MKLMKLKQTLVLSSLIIGLVATQSAYSSYTFDPNGGSGATGVQFDTLDQVPGSAIGIGALTAQTAFIGGGVNDPGNLFTLAYQANLGSTLLVGLPTFSQGGGGQFFNFTMQFQEKFTGATGVGPNSVATFDFVPGGTNVFNMFANNAAGVDLTGAGFGQGTNILSAHIESSINSVFANGPGTSASLDSFGTNDWPTTTTVSGAGATSLRLVVDSVDSRYFPDLSALKVLNLIINQAFNTSQVTPFNQTNPSQNFLWLAGGPYATNVGAINGVSGPDFIFQADGNTSFTNSVPEPSMLLLIGTAIMGFSFTKRARGKFKHG
jgi:hypothetical protein